MEHTKQHNLRNSIRLSEKAKAVGNRVFDFLQRSNNKTPNNNPFVNHPIGQENHPRQSLNNNQSQNDTNSYQSDLDDLYLPWPLENPTPSPFNRNQIHLESQTRPPTPLGPIQNTYSEEQLNTEPQQSLNSTQFSIIINEIKNMKHEISTRFQEIKLEIRQEITVKFEEMKLNFERYSNRIDTEIEHLHFTFKTLDTNMRTELEQLKTRVDLTEKQTNQHSKYGKEQVNYNPLPSKVEEQSYRANPQTNMVPNNQEVILKYITDQGPKKPPQFNGKSQNPVAFLVKLKQYLTKEGRKGQIQSIDDLREIIEDSLVGTASSWWQLNQDHVYDIESFEHIFTNKYWSKEIQKGLKQRIEYEKYRPGGPLNRSEYFMEKAAVLKCLTTNNLDEEEIVNILSEHFGPKIHDACCVQGIKTIQEMERLLNREDSEERNKTLRNHNRGNFHNPGNPNQPNLTNTQNRKHPIPIGNEPHWRNNTNNTFRNEEGNNNRNVPNTYKRHFENNVNHYQRRNHFPTQEQVNVCNMISNTNQTSQNTPTQYLNGNAPSFNQNRATTH